MGPTDWTRGTQCTKCQRQPRRRSARKLWRKRGTCCAAARVVEGGAPLFCCLLSDAVCVRAFSAMADAALAERLEEIQMSDGQSKLYGKVLEVRDQAGWCVLLVHVCTVLTLHNLCACLCYRPWAERSRSCVLCCRQLRIVPANASGCATKTLANWMILSL